MKNKKNLSLLLSLAVMMLVAISCATPAVKKPTTNKPGSTSTQTQTQSQSGPKTSMYEEVGPKAMPLLNERAIVRPDSVSVDSVQMKTD